MSDRKFFNEIFRKLSLDLFIVIINRPFLFTVPILDIGIDGDNAQGYSLLKSR